VGIGQVIWVAIAFTIGSFAQSVSGFGFTLIAVPLLTLAVRPADAVVGQTFASLLLSAWMGVQLWPEADKAMLKRIVPMSFVGMPIGIVVSSRLSDRGLRIGVGIAVISATVAIASGWKLKHVSAPMEYAAGLVSGILNTTTGTNGPPLVVTLAAREHQPAKFRATLQVAFALANVVAIPLFVASGKVTSTGLRVAAIGLVPTLAGRLIGEPVFRRLKPERFRVIVIAMLFAAGTVALIRALS
jgi:uncharacterized protein